MEMKGKPFDELKDTKWVADFAFLVNIVNHLNQLNLHLQGHDKLIQKSFARIEGFIEKHVVFEIQLWENDLTFFPSLASLSQWIIEQDQEPLNSEKYVTEIH